MHSCCPNMEFMCEKHVQLWSCHSISLQVKTIFKCNSQLWEIKHVFSILKVNELDIHYTLHILHIEAEIYISLLDCVCAIYLDRNMCYNCHYCIEMIDLFVQLNHINVPVQHMQAGTNRSLLTGSDALPLRQIARDLLHVLSHRYDSTWNSLW